MINPEPIHRSSSPYRSSGTDKLPLRAVPNQLPPAQAAKPLPGALTPRKPWSRRRKIGTVVLVTLVALFGFGYWRYSSFTSQIVVANTTEKTALLTYNGEKGIDQLNPADFTRIGEGRITILMLGMDATSGEVGLTDSMQLLSIDPITNKSTIVSVPRDFYMKGRSHKLNGTYKFAEMQKAGTGAQAEKDAVGEILGTPISYFVLTNFAGLKELVDAVGGIQVDVPKGFTDPEFPAEKGFGYEPFTVKKGLQNMDGRTALRYTRSRHADSDYGRSARQQLVLEALRTKALSAGVLSNPVKLNSIMNALGKNIKTDMSVDSLRKVFEIYNRVSAENRKSFVLDTSTELGLLTDGSNQLGYISYPAEGDGIYTAIQRWYRKQAPDPIIGLEQPTITVANGGSATSKQLQEMVALLNDFGYRASLSTTTPSKSLQTGKTALYKKADKPFSANYLSTYFSLTPNNGNPLKSESDFELLYSPSKK